MSPAPLAFAAGDVGGARAVLPVARQAVQQGHTVWAMAHGVLQDEGAPDWYWQPPAAWAERAFWQVPGAPRVLFFATSVSDPYAMQAAVAAQAAGVRLIHVLDNWSTYAARLSTPQGLRVVPEIYAVMDDLARDEAIIEGVPPAILRVTGHPNLGHLEQEAARFGPPQNAPNPQRLLVVSEPARADSKIPGWRGYDETSFAELAVMALADAVTAPLRLDVAPHPREDRAEVLSRWRGLTAPHPQLDVAEVPRNGVREALHGAHGVLGMSSILLYEAWLLARPVMSLQPGLVGPALRTLSHRQGLRFVTDPAAAGPEIAALAAEIAGLYQGRVPYQGLQSAAALAQHRAAATTLLALVETDSN